MAEIDLDILAKYLHTPKTICFTVRTHEESLILSQALDALGETWCDGKSYLSENNWETYGERTYYSNHGYYGDVTRSGRDSGNTIVEFDDLLVGAKSEEQKFDEFCKFIQQEA